MKKNNRPLIIIILVFILELAVIGTLGVTSLKRVNSVEKKIEVADELKLPERYQGKFSRLYAYLIQTRGLAPEIRIRSGSCFYPVPCVRGLSLD